MIKQLLIGLCYLLVADIAALAEVDTGLKAYPGSVLVDHDYNDADSFMVNTGSEVLHVRLYFADAPETFVQQAHDARRVQEQAHYFGIGQPQSILYLGEQAAAFTRDMLSKPFTLYTSHARALGGSGSSRVYGFVVTAEGRDLAELLVENGHARNFGVARRNYDGVPHTEIELKLRDLELLAMMKRRGAWELSTPEMLVELRAKQREEKMALQALMVSTTGMLESTVCLNTASQDELERVPGIGPVMAGRIMAGRPYRSLEQLKTISGIGEKLFERISPFLSIDLPKSNNG